MKYHTLTEKVNEYVYISMDKEGKNRERDKIIRQWLGEKVEEIDHIYPYNSKNSQSCIRNILDLTQEQTLEEKLNYAMYETPGGFTPKGLAQIAREHFNQ